MIVSYVNNQSLRLQDGIKHLEEEWFIRSVYVDYCTVALQLHFHSLVFPHENREEAGNFALSWRCKKSIKIWWKLDVDQYMEIWQDFSLWSPSRAVRRGEKKHLQFSLVWNIQKKQWPPWATSLFKGHVVHLRLWQDERLKVIGRPSPSLSATVSLNKCKHVRKQKQQSPGLSSLEILESWLIATLLLCCFCKMEEFLCGVCNY